jgi:hypothetical protein
MKHKQPRRVSVEILISITSALAAAVTANGILLQWNYHHEKVSVELAPERKDVKVINSVLRQTAEKQQLLTNEKLREFAVLYSTNVFNAALQNPNALEKPPEQQDMLHRIQLLETKTDRLEAQLEKVTNNGENLWWKEPSTIWLFVIFWILEKIFSRVIGDLIAIGWGNLKRKIGLSPSDSSKAEILAD